MQTEQESEFGFAVRQVKPGWWFKEEPMPEDAWMVKLPHQCDSWDIAGGDGYPVPHEEAVAAMERFIAEAQAALEALRERREC